MENEAKKDTLSHHFKTCKCNRLSYFFNDVFENIFNGNLSRKPWTCVILIGTIMSASLIVVQ